jgi:hypothetical protein
MSLSRPLSAAQRQALASFQEIVQLQDDNLSVQVLDHCHWDLDLAVSQYVSGQYNHDEQNPLLGTHREDSAQSVFSSSTSTSSGNASSSSAASASDTGSGLFGLLLYPLRWLFQFQPFSVNPDQDTMTFVNEFHRQFPRSQELPISNSSYQSTVQSTFQASKFLIVYLHSPLHGDTDTFCEDVLCSERMRTFLQGGAATLWMGKVWDAEAYALSTQLRASAFPFIALLVCQSQRMVQVAERIQGTRLHNPSTV